MRQGERQKGMERQGEIHEECWKEGEREGEGNVGERGIK